MYLSTACSLWLLALFLDVFSHLSISLSVCLSVYPLSCPPSVHHCIFVSGMHSIMGVPKKVPLVLNITSYLGTAQQDKQLLRNFLWEKGTFLGHPLMILLTNFKFLSQNMQTQTILDLHLFVFLSICLSV